MKVNIQLKTVSAPIEYEAVSTYEKGSYTCVQIDGGFTHKYPTSDIFRVVEDYGYKPDKRKA